MQRQTSDVTSQKIELSYRVFIGKLAKWVVLGCLIGLIVGTTSAVLLKTIKYLTDQREAHPFLLYLLPLGGIFIGYLYKSYGNDAEKGNNIIFENIDAKGKVPLLMGPIVYLGTFITHLFGGSTGREGAAIQMGGSIAESFNRLFNIDQIDQRILLMAGVAGGFGSAFGTPLTGTVFGMEVAAAGKMRYEGLLPCITASFVGHYVTKAWGAPHDHFKITEVPEIALVSMLKVILVSIVFSFVSVLYCKLRHGVQKYSTQYLVTPMLRGFVGGLLIIALVHLLDTRDYTGRGLKIVEQAFTGEVEPFAFLAKLIFTAITMGSGFVGGEAIPLFFVGATLGNTLSGIIGMPTSFLAAIGFISVFCGAANTPISCFLLALEMFEGKALTYFFIACFVSYIFSGPNGVWPSQRIYEPKSRMLNFPKGETIDALSKKRKP